MVSMPGKSYLGAGPVLDDAGQALQRQLVADIDHLATTIGERNVRRQPQALANTATSLETRLTALGYVVEQQACDASLYRTEEADVQGAFSPPHRVMNLVAEKRGSEPADEIVVVGALPRPRHAVDDEGRLAHRARHDGRQLAPRSGSDRRHQPIALTPQGVDGDNPRRHLQDSIVGVVDAARTRRRPMTTSFPSRRTTTRA